MGIEILYVDGLRGTEVALSSPSPPLYSLILELPLPFPPRD